jgi:hypothetical protein
MVALSSCRKDLGEKRNARVSTETEEPAGSVVTLRGIF